MKGSDGIVQVIYWGDIPGHSALKSVNFLAYELIRFYGARGFRLWQKHER